MLRGADRRAVMGALARGAIVPAGALAVHQLRFWLAFGSNATEELRVQGHSYLNSIVPWIVLLIAISAGVFLRALGRALGGRCSLPRHTVSFAALWLACAACLVAIYVCQESLEGLFATGHPGGLAGIFGYGGWWSVPAALAVGLVLAAVLHGARWVLQEVAHRRRRPSGSSRRRGPGSRAPRAAVLPRLVPLADGWSDRGPPR